MPAERPGSFLDSRAARVVAGLIVVLVLATLAYLHRDDLFGSEQAANPDNPALAACIAERTGHVDNMLEEGVIGPEQAESFRTRAIEFCQGTTSPAN